MWNENLLLFFNTGNTGKCPKCGKEKIVVSKIDTPYRTSYDFKCSACGASAHIDGMDKRRKSDL